MFEPDQLIGNYRIVRQLGQGGMGAVYEAVHKDIGRHVAIKVLHQEYSKDPETATRFLNEARAAAIVDHPGIVDIFEYGRLPDGTTFLVMEYVKGNSLRALLKQDGKLLVRDALRISRQIAVALTAAHEKGIIHRDLELKYQRRVNQKAGRQGRRREGRVMISPSNKVSSPDPRRQTDELLCA